MFSLKVESQSEKFLTLILHLDERRLIRKHSPVAERIYQTNRKLFEVLSNTIDYSHGHLSVLRENRESTKINILGITSPKSGDTIEIPLLSFSFHDDNVVRNEARYDFGNGFVFDLNLDNLNDSRDDRYLSSENISRQDLIDGRKMCAVDEVPIFHNQGIKTLVFKDFESVYDGSLGVDYRIELQFTTKIHKYVSDCIVELSKSILFIQDYISEISESRVFDEKSGEFSAHWAEKILAEAGVTKTKVETKINQTMLNASSFAKAADDFIRCLELEGEDVHSNFKNNTVFTLLPVKTTLTKIWKLLKQMQNTLSTLRSLYINEVNFGEEASKINVGVNRANKTPFIYGDQFDTAETYHIDVNQIGYKIFDENDQDDLRIVSNSFLKKRVDYEKAKFFPTVEGIASVPLLTPEQQGNFSKGNSFSPFITPVAMRFREEKFKLNSGPLSLDSEKIKAFRLLKSQVAFQKKGGDRRAFLGSRTFNVERTIQNVNINIGDALVSNLNMKLYGRDADDPIDASEFFGEDSDFSTPEFKIQPEAEVSERIQKRNFDVMTAIVSRRFLEKGNLRSTDEINLAKHDSNSLKAAKNNKFDFSRVPPHLKSLMSPSSFNGGGQFSYKSDPLKNQNTRPILQETQLNIHVVKMHKGFSKDASGNINFSNPILEEITDSNISTGGIKLFVVDKYDNPSIGLDSDGYSPPVFDRVLFTADKGNIMAGKFDHSKIPKSNTISLAPLQTQRPVTLDALRPKFSTSNPVTQNLSNAGVLDLIKQVRRPTIAAAPTGGSSGGGNMGGSSGGGNMGGGY